jgi:hypothetical protein
MLRNKHSSSHVTTNTKPTLERSRSHNGGSLMATSSKANKPLLDPNNILFGSSHDEDLVSESTRLNVLIQLLDS